MYFDKFHEFFFFSQLDFLLFYLTRMCKVTVYWHYEYACVTEDQILYYQIFKIKCCIL
jgi:hypothetical protein